MDFLKKYSFFFAQRGNIIFAQHSLIDFLCIGYDIVVGTFPIK